MAYNRANYIKRIKRIVDIYNAEKHHDVPDTFIVAKIFPKYNIFISYRTWKYIKATPLSNALSAPDNQPSLFN